MSEASFVWELPLGPNELVGGDTKGWPLLDCRMEDKWNRQLAERRMGHRALMLTPRLTILTAVAFALIAQQVAKFQILPRRTNWFEPTAFTRPPSFTYGNSGRNILQGPGWARPLSL